jgi:hypothetical protein
MTEIGRQVDQAVVECWEVARRGHQLDATIRELDGAALAARLARATDPAEQASLQSQIGSLDRIRATRDQTDERLRVLQTRLGELVSQAAEVATDTGAAADPAPGVDGAPAPGGELGSAVDDVVTQLEALRLAIREVNGPAGPVPG